MDRVVSGTSLCFSPDPRIAGSKPSVRLTIETTLDLDHNYSRRRSRTLCRTAFHRICASTGGDAADVSRSGGHTMYGLTAGAWKNQAVTILFRNRRQRPQSPIRHSHSHIFVQLSRLVLGAFLARLQFFVDSSPSFCRKISRLSSLPVTHPERL